jgi:3-oxoacyl-[acyl-carrier-protein] synthase-1
MIRAGISGMGACTPLGLTVSSTEAAFRAGLMPARETRMKSRGGEPIRALYLDLLPDSYRRDERMAALAGHALDDLSQSAPIETGGPVSVFVGLPDLDEESFAAATLAIASLVSARASVAGPPMYFCQGRSALFFALDAALESLAAGACDRALVGAVESLCSPEVLKYLDADRRLLGLAADGIIPAEGAAFLLLERTSIGSGGSFMMAVATGRESRHFGQIRPSSAQALSGVFRALRAQPAARGRRAGLMYTCETGEHFWSQEFALAYLRNTAIMPEPFFKTIAAESFGDLGAAAGGVMLVMGTYALGRMASRGQSERLLLLCGCSDDGHVGACLIEGPAGTPVEV